VFEQIRKFIYKNVFKKKYFRVGSCNGCGACCTHIYVKHMKGVVKTEEEFKKLQLLHPFYTYLTVIGKDETGLYFECMNLDKDTKKCKIHKKRPGICRRYPQEEIFLLGGTLKDDCGYSFTPIESFDEIFTRIQNKEKNNFRTCACLQTNFLNKIKDQISRFFSLFKENKKNKK